MQAISAPLISPARADGDAGPQVFAVLASAPMRHTADHAHARGQAIAAISGVLTVSTEQQRLIVAPGQAIWIPPHHRHGLDVHGPCRGWSVYIAEAACAALPLLPQVMQVSGLLREAVLRASGWCDALSLDAAQARVAAVILDEIATLPRQRLVLPLPADRRLLKIARQLIADPADQRPLLEWAAWAGIAPRTLTRRFALETGLSFSSWRQRARLMRAMELLAGGAAVTSTAIDLGYDSLSAFIAMFRKTLGVSPARFAALPQSGAPAI